jgi:ribonuclease VapC
LIADTSVLVAISLAEEGSESLATALRSSRRAAIGAATLVESRIVLEGRLGDDGRRLLDAVLASGVIAVEPFTVTHADVAVDAFRRYGKGRHPARLNVADCMVYATASLAREPLLSLDNGFSLTDLELVAL